MQIFAQNRMIIGFVKDCTWRPRKLSCWLRKWLIWGGLAIWIVHVLEKIIISMLLSSSRDKLTLSWQNSVTDVSVGFRPPCWSPSRWTPACVSIQISINLGKNFLRISCLRKSAVTWILAWGFAHFPLFFSQIVEFIHWTVLIFISIYFKNTENQK